MAGFADAKVMIKAFIADNWDEVPVAFQNDDGTVDKPVEDNGQPKPWMYCEILPTASAGSPFGSKGTRVKTDTGLIAGHLFVPVGSGDESADATARRFGELLELQSIGGPSGPRTEAAQPGGGGQGDDDGRYYRVSTTIPFAIHYSA